MTNEQKSRIYERFEDDRDFFVRVHESFTIEEKIVLACRILAEEGHSEQLAGQITVRSEAQPDLFLTPGIGRTFGELTAEDICLIDSDLKVIDSDHQLNPALRFHMWLYRVRPEVRCLVHTHPPYAAALSMVGRPLRVAHMDTAMFHDDCAYLAEWPGVPFSDEEGRIISEAMGQNRSILLAHHGILTAGASIEEATYLAVFMERAARLQVMAESIGTIRDVPAEYAKDAHDFLLKPSVVIATFNAWARKHQREMERLASSTEHSSTVSA